MSMKKIINYSPNFNLKKRNSTQIKFIIFHYTGMKKEQDAIKKLTNIQSQVSSHYLIKNNGDVVIMVPDLYVAWHAGKSSWKNFKSLNKNSIGIEISNPGHAHNYINFSKSKLKFNINWYFFTKFKKRNKIINFNFNFFFNTKNLINNSYITDFTKINYTELNKIKPFYNPTYIYKYYPFFH